MLGFLFYFVYTILLCSQLYTVKGIFRLNPTITIVQLAFLKSAISFLLVASIFNRKLKNIMVDSIDKD